MPPPPTRPRTPESIHSWWSDSNPVGPTISIHAVAKPLMRLMYHEQVRSFIKRNHGTLLSRATLEIYFSYLVYAQYKYISPATKTLILKEFAVRAEVRGDATTMLDSFLVEWDLVVELLSSSDSQIRRYTSNVLGALVSSMHESTPLVLDVCQRIVSLLSDNDIEIRESALHAVAKIAETPDGARAVRDLKVWEYLPESTELTKSDEDNDVHSAAMLALWGINYHLVDAHTLVYPTILTHFAEHLDSSAPRIRQLACRMLGALAGSRRASLTNLSFDLCVRVAPLLSDRSMKVRRSAVHALSGLSYWPGGCQALEAQIAERVPQLLTSSDKNTVRSTCEMLGNMGYHNRKVDADLCECVSALLGNEDVREAAIQALAKISRSSGGAHAVGDTAILGHVAGLLDFDRTRFSTLDTLSNLVFYRAIPELDAVLRIQEQVTPFLSDPDGDIRKRAMSALIF
ncbi:armadillo-type protein [Mycena leptocephala]|nr:armadillo-type protein [Mycena leptocephala]